MKNVVIIGASHAAAETISTLRKSGWADKITLIDEEDHLPYQRPPLSKGYYKGEVSVEKLLIKKPDFYQSANIDLMLGRRVKNIKRETKQVVLENGELVKYDKLVLATGTRARQLSMEGGDIAQVKYSRTMDDVDAIKGSIKPGGKLLIIGAGYIGLEVAASAVKQGVSVVVLETMNRVLARVTSPTVSEFFQTVHAEEGVDIRLETSLDKFTTRDGKSFAILSDGEQLEFDCAIVGIGVIPNVELVDEIGLECDNGIVVDEFTQTSDADIYAVGDCSNHPSFIYDRRIRLESVPNAIAQAKTAANAICGNKVAYNQLPWFWSDQYNIKLQTAGLIQGYDKTAVSGDIVGRKFTVSYFKDQRLIALDAINSPADFLRAKKIIVTDGNAAS